MKNSTKRGQRKGRPYTPKPKQASIMARYFSGQSDREIARQEGVSRGTVYRVRAQNENLMLVQSYRDMILDLVPNAIKVLGKLIKREDRQAVIETLYGTRVLIQRHEVEKVEEPVRTFAYTKAEFFAVHGRLPLQAELEEFEKHLPIEPLTKAE